MTNPRCKLCRYFQESPFTFEKIFPSVIVLSSGFGSTKGGQGLCSLKNCMVLEYDACDRFLLSNKLLEPQNKRM